MKQFLSLLLLGSFSLINISFAAGNQSFTDVPEDHQYFDAIEWVKNNGIAKGYSDGTFKSDQTISRAEFVKMLLVSKYASWSISDEYHSGAFPDVLHRDWFSSYVVFAKENNIVGGYPDGTFGPGKDVNFAEAAKIISILHLGLTYEPDLALPWYALYIQEFRMQNLPTYDPNHLLTRGEMANILYDIYGDENSYDTIIPKDNTPLPYEEEQTIKEVLGEAYSGLPSLSTLYHIQENLYLMNINYEMGGSRIIYFYYEMGFIRITEDISNTRFAKNPEDPFLTEHEIYFGASLPEQYQFPETLHLENGSNLNQETWVAFHEHEVFELNPYLLRTGLADPEYGEIFTDSKNALVLRGDDFVSRKYSISIPFLEDNQLANISWNNGVDANKHDLEYRRGYTYQDQGGCGSTNYASVVTPEKSASFYTNTPIYINPETDFVQTGTGVNGESIYELKDSNHLFLQEMYEHKYFEYDGEKMSYEEFISVHPVFFWQDNFGRWIKFESNRFIPQAECGKPVVYLYPEEETEVHVKVAPKGGFSITIPEHGENGWTVLAKPNGDLIEVATGEEYPYLFWEGKGGIYDTPSKGWVIAKSEADFFVAGKLRQFGFNTQEIIDFLEFWSPKLQEGEDEYLWISFWGTQYMDSIAPIEITPAPDSILRVLMDYHETPEFYETTPPRIPQFKREGFVVTEWGGTLWR